MIWYFIVGAVVATLAFPLIVSGARDYMTVEGVEESPTDTALIAVVAALFFIASLMGWPVAVIAWLFWLAIRPKQRGTS